MAFLPKRIVNLLTIAGMLLLSAQAFSNDENALIRFMSFNFQNGYGGAEFGATRFVGVVPTSSIEPKSDADLKQIAEVINRSKPGILAAQEVESLEAARVFNEKYLNSRYMLVADRGTDQSSRNIVYFIDKSLPFEYELENHWNESWSPKGDGHQVRLFSRGLPTLLVYDRGAAKGSVPRAVVLATHNRSKKNFFSATTPAADALGNVQRETQFTRVQEIIKDYKARFGAKLPVVFMGDMNSGPEELPAKFVQETGLKNVHDLTEPALPKEARATLVDASKKGMEFDRIYVSDSLNGHVQRTGVGRFRDESGNEIPLQTNRKLRKKLASDHLPAEADIEIPLAPSHAPVSSADVKNLGPENRRYIPGQIAPSAVDNGGIALVPTTPEIYQDALKTKLKGELNVRFPTSIFQRETDLLSAIVPELPMKFADFSHDPIRLGFSSKVGDLGDLSLQDALKLTRSLKELRGDELTSAGLLKTVPVLDPKNLKVVAMRSGDHGYLALQPSKEFRTWQSSMAMLLGEKLGKGFDPGSGDASIPLLTWSITEEGSTVSDERLEQARTELEKLIQAKAKKLSVSGKAVERTFDFSDHSIELVGSHDGGVARNLASFQFDAEKSRVQATDVMSWIAQHDLPDPKTGGRWSLMELDTEKALAGDRSVQGTAPGRDFRVFNSLPRNTARLNPEDLAESLKEPLRSIYLRESEKLGSTFDPRVVQGIEDSGTGLYLIDNHHPMLAPHKTEKVSELLKVIGTPHSDRVFSGYAVYGSYARAEYDRPSDVDLLMNNNVIVPDTIRTQKEAEDYVTKVFMSDVMDHFRNLAREGKLAFIEGRVGSDATMKIPSDSPNPLTAFNTNPYLTHQEIMNGSFVDKRTGKRYTLEQLVRLGDFTKFKLDYFHPDGRRDELSLQFVLGYEWKGHSYLLRRNGFKGAISSLLPTAVYFGDESYAVGAALAKNVALYASQFGDPVARSIGELIEVAKFEHDKPYIVSDPVWRSKIFKRFYASIGFLQRNARPGMDHVFFEDMMKFLGNNGPLPKTTLAQAIQHVVVAVNQPDLEEVNGLKRIANDFKELNERDQLMTKAQWESRALEFEHWKKKLEKSSLGDKLPEKLKQAIRDMDLAVQEAKAAPSLEKANSVIVEPGHNEAGKLRQKVFSNLEDELVSLEGRLITDASFSREAIPKESQELVRTMVALMPHLYARYSENRAHLPKEDLRLAYAAMGVHESDESYQSMRKTSAELFELSKEELAARQAVIFGGSHAGSNCVLKALEASSHVQK